MTEEYIHKDIFDAETARLKAEIDALNKRIDDTRDAVNKGVAFLGIAVGLFAVLMAGIQIAVAIAPIIAK